MPRKTKVVEVEQEIEPESAPEEVEETEEVDILAAGAARQRKQEDAGAASTAIVEEVQEEKPKKKKEVTEAQRAHLANIRVKALKVKAEKKLLREKAKELEKAELELKAQRYDNAVEEKNKLKTPPNKK